MPTLFNVVRATIFSVSLLFAIVVLGIAAYLDSILEPSELTTFVSLALAVSILTILCTAVILFFGSREREYFITHARWEIGLSGIVGILWLVLGLYMSLQPLPDVDCPVDANGVSADYTTDEFHAQYHALQAFAVLELILLCGWSIFLFTLAMRHHLSGRKQVWNARVNEAPWFAARNTATASSSPDDKFTRLPPPISSRPRHRRGFSTPAISFFTRRNGERPAMGHVAAESQSSLSTAESGEVLAATAALPYRSGRQGPGIATGHSRARSDPLMRSTNPYAAAIVTPMPSRPPIGSRAATTTSIPPTPPPKTATATPLPQRGVSDAQTRPGMSSRTKPVPNVPVSRSPSASKKPPTSSAAAAGLARAGTGSSSRNATTANPMPSSGRKNSTSSQTRPAKPTLERRPTTTSTPAVYVPTPAGSALNAYQRNGSGSTQTPIAAAMMRGRTATAGTTRPPVAGNGGAPRNRGTSGSRERR